ncbi:hypothetical protein CGCF413_v006500 [Colletotrichum fructicola]|nr:hypothetical protein CGCF413_v006500 [Colletotrichum fructicola]
MQQKNIHKPIPTGGSGFTGIGTEMCRNFPTISSTSFGVGIWWLSQRALSVLFVHQLHGHLPQPGGPPRWLLVSRDGSLLFVRGLAAHGPATSPATRRGELIRLSNLVGPRHQQGQHWKENILASSWCGRQLVSMGHTAVPLVLGPVLVMFDKGSNGSPKFIDAAFQARAFRLRQYWAQMNTNLNQVDENTFAASSLGCELWWNLQPTGQVLGTGRRIG